MALDIAVGIVIAMIFLYTLPLILVLLGYVLYAPFWIIGAIWEWIKKHVSIK